MDGPGPLLAVDLGATTLRTLVGDAAGQVLGRADRPTPQGPTGADVAQAVLSCATEASRSAGFAPGELTAAGIAALGPLDLDAGAVVEPSNLPVDRIDLVAPLATLLDVNPARVTLLNDAAAGALGEHRWADAPDNTVFLTISTGLGAGAIVDGHLLVGEGGNAAELGHVVVEPEGRLTCGCGGAGHWEAYCSGAAIPTLARWLAREREVETGLPLDDLDAAEVFAHAGEGDPLVDRVLDEVAGLNALGVATAVQAFAPATVRVGGGVALANETRVLDPIRERLPAHLAVPAPAVELAHLGGDAGVMGALAAAATAVGRSE